MDNFLSFANFLFTGMRTSVAWKHKQKVAGKAFTINLLSCHFLSFQLFTSNAGNEKLQNSTTGFRTASEKNGKRFFRVSRHERKLDLLMDWWSIIQSSDWQQRKWVKFLFGGEGILKLLRVYERRGVGKKSWILLINYKKVWRWNLK